MTENERLTINGKEVILYREVETNLYRFSKDAVDMFLEALEEREQYRAIGTVEEFKHYKHIVHMAELAIDSVEKEKAEIRNKAIDEFVERLKLGLDRKFSFGLENKFKLFDSIDEIAEQMKGVQ